jgi:antirestriction protein
MNEELPTNTPEREPKESRPRVWIASLADYNAGRLHGEWVDAAVDAADLTRFAQHIVDTSPEPGAEEWAIFDYDNFGTYRIHEYEDLATVAAVARGIAKFGPAFAVWAEQSETNIDDMESGFEDAFLGFYESRDDYLDTMLDDLGASDAIDKNVPQWLVAHVSIDRDGLINDVQASGDIHIEDAPGGGIYVFRL